jgi:hypothetical protein
LIAALGVARFIWVQRSRARSKSKRDAGMALETMEQNEQVERMEQAEQTEKAKPAEAETEL